MIRSRPLVGLSELCILHENSEEVHNLQSHYGLLDENAEEVHNLHRNMQSPDGLLDENSEEVHNLQSPDEKMCSWRPSELCLLDENSSIICNLLMKNKGVKSTGATIRIGQDILWVPYAGFFYINYIDGGDSLSTFPMNPAVKWLLFYFISNPATV